MDAIKFHILFHVWNTEEILEFVDTFVEFNVEGGKTIFNEGDDGTYFYIIESDSMNVDRKHGSIHIWMRNELRRSRVIV